jgi:hypothetical protein
VIGAAHARGSERPAAFGFLPLSSGATRPALTRRIP